MYTIKGEYAGALITIDNLDRDAVKQLYGLLNAKASEGSKVAIMPDGHPGKDCLVGFTQKFNDDAEVRFVPNFIREHITPTAEVADRLVPLYNFKG